MQVTARTLVAGAELTVELSAPRGPVERLHLRWRLPVDPALLVLGDAWERSYGDLGWRGIIPERVMPWYFATVRGEGGKRCDAYGVRTGAGALCFWQLDPEGVSLWLDTGNGGGGVMLGTRSLAAATVVARRGLPGEDTTDALRAFCRQLAALPSLPVSRVYGFNDWYYAYGRNTAQQILQDTDLLAELAAGHQVRPFSVIDDGWDNGASDARQRFPDMAALAAGIRARQVRPGIWIRRRKRLPVQTRGCACRRHAAVSEKSVPGNSPTMSPCPRRGRRRSAGCGR